MSVRLHSYPIFTHSSRLICRRLINCAYNKQFKNIALTVSTLSSRRSKPSILSSSGSRLRLFCLAWRQKGADTAEDPSASDKAVIRRKWGNASQFTPVGLLRLAVGQFLASSINLGARFRLYARPDSSRDFSRDAHNYCLALWRGWPWRRTADTEVQTDFPTYVCILL